MKLSTLSESLWGNKARFSYLLVAAAILIFSMLGAREIWTQEHRWADIVFGMFYRHDFLHPYLGENTYYDKPLLSYWLIVFFSAMAGELTTWTLRLPSALSGLLAIWSIYRLGTVLKDRQLGLLAGWILLTCFYFVFWARTSSADMLNLGGSLFAIAWYFDKRDHTSLFDYSVFFMIIALTSLCKGLVGAIVPLLAVFIDMCLQKSWRHHLRLTMLIGALPALIVYLIPFLLSSYFGGDSYGQSGLYMVFRENVLRYFQPFDHQGPIYTYFIFLPIYLMPWAIFFVPALYTLKARWQGMTINSRWIVWTLLALFLFFTLSGSRRSYYVLPMVPIAILFTADWILSATAAAKRQCWSAGLVVLSLLVLFVALDAAPAWYYSQYGVTRFSAALQHEASQIKPWPTWNVVTLDAESKLNFYLQLAPTTKHYGVPGTMRGVQTAESLLQTWPILKNKPENTIFISRKLHADALRRYFVGYRMLAVPLNSNWSFIKKHDANSPIAFIPTK